jgi:hypothetical protein
MAVDTKSRGKNSGNDLIDALMQAISPEARNEAETAYWEKNPIEIKREGSRIVLPADPRAMQIPQAIEALQRIHDEENQIRQVHEAFDGYPMDAAVAFTKAMKHIYGYATPVPTMTFFGPQPPQMITVKTGPKDHETTQVMIGEFKVPNIENNIETGVNRNGRFYVSGHVRKAEETVLLELAYVAKQFLKSESIYRGKAMSFRVGEGGELYQGMEPTFIETDNYKPEELILRRDVERALDISLFTPIRHTQTCIKNNIPLKRGILLEGVYGTGKSMSASVTARLCVDNGWTFILLDKVQGLKAALEFANLYSPAVVFAEDIDRITETRDEKANDLLNTIDGVIQKNSAVITVLTTNHIEKINKAMLRPGRLDAVINVKAPDAEAVERLVRLYGRGLISADTNLAKVGTTLDGMIPASIREVVERAKLAMISRGDTLLSVEDMLAIHDMMQHHLDLMKNPEGKVPSNEEAVGIALRNLVGNPTAKGGEIDKKVDTVQQYAVSTHRTVDLISNAVAELGQMAEKANKANGKTLDNLVAKLSTKEQVDKVLKAIAH